MEKWENLYGKIHRAKTATELFMFVRAKHSKYM